MVPRGTTVVILGTLDKAASNGGNVRQRSSGMIRIVGDQLRLQVEPRETDNARLLIAQEWPTPSGTLRILPSHFLSDSAIDYTG